MAKVIDITDKLTFDGNPSLVIKGKKIEVNSDAPTMLKVMGIMGNGDPGVEEIMKTYNLMFSEKAQKEIGKLGLSFQDLVVAIQEAVQLIVGEKNSQGE